MPTRLPRHRGGGGAIDSPLTSFAEIFDFVQNVFTNSEQLTLKKFVHVVVTPYHEFCSDNFKYMLSQFFISLNTFRLLFSIISSATAAQEYFGPSRHTPTRFFHQKPKWLCLLVSYSKLCKTEISSVFYHIVQVKQCKYFAKNFFANRKKFLSAILYNQL